MLLILKLIRKCSARLCVVILMFGSEAHATFYQSDTLGDYCREYIRYVQLEKPANQLEAGICSGYVASTIELMSLSERLCGRDELNLDTVIKKYIKEIDSDQKQAMQSATFVLVDLLQKVYACD